MNGAVFALIVNACIALLFATSFAVIAATQPTVRAARWFCVSYLIGMLTPLSELLVHARILPAVFMWTSYGAFLLSFVVATAGIDRMRGREPDVRVAAAIVLLGIVTRALIWGGPRNDLLYEMTYQLPYALACTAMFVAAARVERPAPTDFALATILGLTTIHFIVKPVFAATFGSGQNAVDYATSAYALYSQATSGVLLVATGLLLLLTLVGAAMTEARRSAEVDPRSGLLNRRGFDRAAERALAVAAQRGKPVAALMLDLDHFKAVNDTHGHATGDQVIAAFGRILADVAPASAILGRMGGEEFALLLPGTGAHAARLHGETIALALARLEAEGLPRVTVSGGVAERTDAEPLGEMMRRADQAAYFAKRAGRDRIVDRTDLMEDTGNVFTMRARTTVAQA